MSGPEDIYVRIIMLADEAQRDMPAGRETSLALTRLDEAAFWARASVLRSRGRSIHAQDDAAVADRHEDGLDHLAPGAGAAARMGIDLMNRAIQEAARDIHRAMGPLAEHCICGQRWDSHDKAQCKPPGYKPPRWWQFWRAA